MGFLKSSIQVRARYNRCKLSWREHLDKTRAMILKAAQMAPGRRRAVVFGAGLLHDIPLFELSQMFESVILADMVHTWPCRLKALQFSNVKLLRLDVTGVVEQLPKALCGASVPLPVSGPMEFIDDPLLDFTVSVNLLSQLPWVPGHFLAGSRSEREISAMKSQLIYAHLEYLKRLPGHTSLITDTTWKAVPLRGAVQEKEEVWDVLSGVCLPEALHAWDWVIAPSPERSPDTDYIARVQAYPDWKNVCDTASGALK